MLKFFSLCLILLAADAHPRLRGAPRDPPKMVGFIVGGNDVDPINKYPHQIMVDYTPNFEQWWYVCSGALIKTNRVVTAGTCVTDPISGVLLDPANYRIAAGVYTYSGLDSEISVPVSEFRLHPNFQVITQNRRQADVAVLRLSVQLDTRNSRIGTITMATEVDGDLIGWQAWASGWGKIDKTGLIDPENLQEIQVGTLTNNQCQNRMNNIGYQNTIVAEHICVQASSNDKGICDGDWGAPLTVVNTTSGTTRLGGIASWVPGTVDEPCLTNVPSVFSRVSSYRDWLNAQ